MDFDVLYNRISPRLKQMARRQCYGSLSFDENDLYQAMCVHLWNNFKDGVPDGLNDNYIVNGCRFHILNYIRTEREKASLLSLEDTLCDGGSTLKDFIESKDEPLHYNIDRKIIYDYVRNNGFSKREKEVFFLLLEGRTMREVGKCLGISHVMVIKYKKKVTKELKILL